MNKIAITIGEPSGIGPEIALKAAWALKEQVQSVLIGDFDFLKELANKFHIPVASFEEDLKEHREGVFISHVPLAKKVVPGVLDVQNAPSVLAFLDHAVAGILNGTYSALATAPIQKSVINEAGISFTGHTEYLAEKLNAKRVVMMLAGKTAHGPLRVALATTHLPLKEVSSALTQASFKETLLILHHDLKTKFKIQHPKIYVAGLNPHAGEGGFLGREEIEVITPVLDELKRKGFDLVGPLSADTLFLPHNLEKADCFLTLYHDQGLPVLKYATFGHGINITLGLPIIRTSVDHGTALDLAGKGIASDKSMQEAILLARDLL